MTESPSNTHQAAALLDTVLLQLTGIKKPMTKPKY